MQSVRQDIRYALRVARENRWSTAAAIFALTIGIGATVMMFTIINAEMLLPLPLNNAARLVRVFETAPKRARTLVSMRDYVDWKHDLTSFDGMALFTFSESNLTGSGTPKRVKVLECESSLLPLMGLPVIRGRNFTPQENQPGDGRSVMLSVSLWQSRFGGQNVIGKKIWLNDQPYIIVGIMPDALNVLGESDDVAVPVTFDFTNIVNTRGFERYRVLARLRPGVSLKQAVAETSSLARVLAQKYPKRNGGIGVSAMYLHRWMSYDVRPALLILFGAVCSVLLIACGNIANLLLVRASVRRREMSVRIAMGANRWRLVRQLWTECLLLSLSGAALGLGLAAIGVYVIKTVEASHLPRPADVALDWRVVAFTVAVAVASSMIFGLAPAFSISRARANDALKELSGRTTESRGHQNTKRVFIAITAAIATLLLIESGLLIRSFAHLSGIDPGFDPHHVLTVRLALPEARYDAAKHPGVVGNFIERLRRRIETIPGIQSAAFTSNLPLTSSQSDPILVKGKVPPKTWWDTPMVRVVQVSPNYFKTMKVPFVAGRDFNDHDDNNSQVVAIVNQSFVRRFLTGQEAVGSVVRPYLPMILWFHIVGVVRDFHQGRIDEPTEPEMFTCIIQQEQTQVAMVARTSGKPLAFVNSIKKIVHEADPSLPAYRVLTMSQVLRGQMGWRAFHTSVLTALAGIALLLAAIGIYAVAAYSVAARTAEIGVRMALGAQRSDIVRMVLWGGTMPAICGTFLGAVCALALRKALAGFLYGITATDLPTYAAVIAFLIFVSLAATFIPALRAASIDPSRALRYQ
ncbi:MAG TPA: ABC transporter permease [Bryobacteraceae bacterium]